MQIERGKTRRKKNSMWKIGREVKDKEIVRKRDKEPGKNNKKVKVPTASLFSCKEYSHFLQRQPTEKQCERGERNKEGEEGMRVKDIKL